MKYAIAINRAGEIVDAMECDHSSARLLKLKCPFCHQAIVWKQGHRRRAPGQKDGEPTVLVEPAFAHYAGFNGDDCELRSTTKEGRITIEEIRIASKGQRLDVYNRDLWEMILNTFQANRAEDEGSRRALNDAIKATRALMKPKVLKAKVIAVAKILKEPRLRSDADEVLASALRDFSALGDFSEHQESAAYLNRLTKVDMDLHYKIGEEVREFLSTRTGRWTLERMTLVSIQQQLTEMHTKGSIPSTAALRKNIPLYPERAIRAGILTMIHFTDWVGEISKRIGEKP